MKKVILAMTILLLSGAAMAQLNPVSWTFTAKKTGDKTYELHMTATISGNYHLYAQKNTGDVSAAVVTFIKNPLLTLQGGVKEVGKLVSKYEEVWKTKVNYYENKVDFVQIIKSKVAVPATIKGGVNYMVCNDRQCLPPKDANFEVKLGN